MADDDLMAALLSVDSAVDFGDDMGIVEEQLPEEQPPAVVQEEEPKKEINPPVSALAPSLLARLMAQDDGMVAPQPPPAPGPVSATEDVLPTDPPSTEATEEHIVIEETSQLPAESDVQAAPPEPEAPPAPVIEIFEEQQPVEEIVEVIEEEEEVTVEADEPAPAALEEMVIVNDSAESLSEAPRTPPLNLGALAERAPPRQPTSSPVNHSYGRRTRSASLWASMGPTGNQPKVVAGGVLQSGAPLEEEEEEEEDPQVVNAIASAAAAVASAVEEEPGEDTAADPFIRPSSAPQAKSAATAYKLPKQAPPKAFSKRSEGKAKAKEHKEPRKSHKKKNPVFMSPPARSTSLPSSSWRPWASLGSRTPTDVWKSKERPYRPPSSVMLPGRMFGSVSAHLPQPPPLPGGGVLRPPPPIMAPPIPPSDLFSETKSHTRRRQSPPRRQLHHSGSSLPRPLWAAPIAPALAPADTSRSLTRGLDSLSFSEEAFRFGAEQQVQAKRPWSTVDEPKPALEPSSTMLTLKVVLDDGDVFGEVDIGHDTRVGQVRSLLAKGLGVDASQLRLLRGGKIPVPHGQDDRMAVQALAPSVMAKVVT